QSSKWSLIGVSLGFRGGIGGLMQPRLDLLRRPVVLPRLPAVITTQLDPRLRSQRLVTTDRGEQRLLRVTDLPPRGGWRRSVSASPVVVVTRGDPQRSDQGVAAVVGHHRPRG